MKLTRSVVYALQATLQLARAEPGTPVPCSRLASEGEMPERFLLHILRNLVTHGILRSTRGVDGGYALQRPAHEVSLLEIIEAIDGPLDSSVQLGNGMSQQSQHNLKLALDHVALTARQQLEAIKLAQLIKPGS